jgi:hypothetical protein
MVKEFDEKSLKAAHPGIYNHFLRDVEKKTAGKAGYVRITIPG